MTPEEFRRIEAVFREALERPPSERQSFVSRSCAGDSWLRSQVEHFLRVHAEAAGFLEEPLVETLGLARHLDSQAAALEPGAILLNRFTIIEPLENAGQSSLYLAKDIRLNGKLVIVKIISRLAEAHALSAVSHPSVAGILEFGILDNGAQFVVVERVAGTSLRQLLRGGGLRSQRALRLIRQIAATVAHAHDQGISHLDLKPENVIVSDEGTSEERANLLDFGLARIEGAQTSQLGGSLGYIAPEQWRGEPEYQSDIYSLGVMLRELLTGALPGRDAHRRVGGPIEEVIRKATAVNSQDRFPSCREFIAALERASRRLKIIKAITIALIATLCLCIGAYLWPRFRDVRRPVQTLSLGGAGGVQWVALSPDGRKLYFAAGSRFFEYVDIYMRDLVTGATRALTTDSNFKLTVSCSPDGKRVAFFRDLGFDKLTMVAMPADGGPERELFTGYLWTPSWADAFRILAADRAEGEKWRHVRVFDIRAGASWDLTPPPTDSRGDDFPALSPDGRTVSFVHHETRESSDIYLLPVDGNLRAAGSARRLTHRRARVADPQWISPDEILFAGGTLDRRKLYRVNAHGGDPVEVPESPAAVDTHAVASRMRRIAFIEQNERTSIWRVDLASPEGPVTHRRRLLQPAGNESAGDAAFSPDGRSVTFVSSRSGEPQVWIADAAGGHPRQMTNEAAADGIETVWLPDSSGIVAYVRSRAFGIRNFLMRPGEAAAREIPAVDGRPIRFSRDGRWLYFASSKTGGYELYNYAIDTHQVRQVTRGCGAAHGIESPDGRTIFYSMQEEDRGLWQIPIRGGKPSQVVAKLARRTLFDVNRHGVYYIFREPKQAVLRFRSFQDGRDIELYRLEGVPGWGLSVSPDERSILYSESDRENANVSILDLPR